MYVVSCTYMVHVSTCIYMYLTIHLFIHVHSSIHLSIHSSNVHMYMYNVSIHSIIIYLLYSSFQAFFPISFLRYRFSSGKDSDSEIEFYNKKEKEIFRNIKYTKKEEEEKKGLAIHVHVHVRVMYVSCHVHVYLVLL